ncbi:unconventional myosin-XVIIIa isoform X4 [Anabrus simplex]|uniref:unconventional myosin-XVIIIa isoform X4 n=1 Tax=Anabrus simplex TaxID=316456 RepID=UPI0035A2BB84
MPSASPASKRPAIKPAAHRQPSNLPRVVGAELKNGTSSPVKKTELRRSSSSEGVLQKKAAGARKVAPVRNLKRSLSSEGVLDCRNLSLAPKVPPLPQISSDNLSTVIAVDYDSSPHSSIGTHDTVQVITQSEDVPLSSTIIAVNYSTGETNGCQPPLPPRTRYFNGKSSVWSKLESKQSSNIAVNINIKQGLAEETDPPPVPPLPSSLVTKHFTNVNPSVSPPAVPPRNGERARPSRIPRKLVPPTGLTGVDCLASSDEEKLVSGSSEDEASRRQAWEELIKKYEALEEECSVHSSEDEKKSTEDVFKAVVAKVVTDEKEQFVNLNTILGKSKVSENIAKFEARKEPTLFRSLKCADTIHLYHAGGYWTSSKRQCRTPTEQTKEPSERRTRRNSDGDEPSSGGIGVVRASTGRQVSDSRFRTELEIFFRSGVLAQLEAQRDERLTDHVVRLQAQCRGYLARRRLAKLKIQDLAVRCIQRNVRKFMSVRDWPWWRLLVRVTPLLNVHRTEEELRLKTEELEMLRAKVEKLEEERGHLKHDTDRLEAKLSEMTADLAEEHSTATLATERLEAETSERLRLEKELQDVQHENKSLHQQGERLEMELLYMRAADMNGVGSEDEEDGEGDVGVYKQRYERAARELEFTKRRMQQQHEDDLEQLVGLKKQLEKKLADAYEEVEEQRQVVGQWKRKVQKLNAETNDLRLLLEEQSSRNNLLEKKQRKFDSELQLLQDELRQEKQQKERLSREKELAVAEKYTMEQNLGAVRLELELKEERVAALTQELDELMFGGKTEEEVAHLKKTKHELEKKVKEQEEELDDLAGQVQLLEQAKLRLEMSLEQQRKENRRETAQRDEELEDVRCNAHKKVKALEAQLESEHEERTLLLREKHELERRLSSMEEQERTTRATDEDQLHRLRRDLKRTKALLRDAQTMLERARGESPGKALIRQLRNQLEDAEFARSAAVKARQGAELELQEVQGQLEEAQRARSEAEERAVAANKERSELRTQLEENEEELAEVLKKYRAAVQQLSVDQLALQEQAGRVAELESERASLREQLAELGSRLESMETLGDPSSSLMQKRLELRTKELESKLELEQTTRSRLEVQITRLKEAVEKLQDEAASARAKEQLAQDNARKLQRTLRELREEHTSATAREAEAQQRRRDIEKRLETAEAEASAARGDLRLALTRIEDLQSAMQGELEDDLSNSDGENSESDHESEGSDESINTFLANHKVRVNSTPRAARPSFELDITSRSVEVTKKPTEASGKESFA